MCHDCGLLFPIASEGSHKEPALQPSGAKTRYPNPSFYFWSILAEALKSSPFYVQVLWASESEGEGLPFELCQEGRHPHHRGRAEGLKPNSARRDDCGKVSIECAEHEIAQDVVANRNTPKGMFCCALLLFGNRHVQLCHEHS